MKIFAALAFLLAFSACREFDDLLCAPCEDSGCGAGLSCVDGVCAPEGRFELCPGHGCGGQPACADGFECFEEECRTPIDVALGSNHACVLWPSGQVSCWGQNTSGQLGRSLSDA